jgi:hypothetical protein
MIIRAGATSEFVAVEDADAHESVASACQARLSRVRRPCMRAVRRLQPIPTVVRSSWTRRAMRDFELRIGCWMVARGPRATPLGCQSPGRSCPNDFGNAERILRITDRMLRTRRARPPRQRPDSRHWAVPKVWRSRRHTPRRRWRARVSPRTHPLAWIKPPRPPDALGATLRQECRTAPCESTHARSRLGSPGKRQIVLESILRTVSDDRSRQARVRGPTARGRGGGRSPRVTTFQR